MKFIGVSILFLIAVLLRAVVLTDLWLWFMVPLGLIPLLNYWHALGFSLTVGYLTVRIDLATTKNPKATQMMSSLIWSLLMWGTGAIYHWGMST